MSEPFQPEKFLIDVKGGKRYLPAAYRIQWFRETCPVWGIETMLVEGGQEAGFCTVAAKIITPEGRVIATAHKTETRQDFPAGWVEKAETGAIGRALALCGFGTQFCGADLDEGERIVDSPQGSASKGSESHGDAPKPGLRVWTGDSPCPSCHAPSGKPHGSKCEQT